MTFQSSTVTIVSDNPLYPQNKIDVTVDNDLTLTRTVVIPNASFPYIVQFENCAEAVGKRYISEYTFKKLTNPVKGSYTTKKGRIFYTLQKGFSPFPYITLDYNIFRKKVLEERKSFLVERNEKVRIFDYLGTEIQDFDFVSPEFLLKWLDLPITDANNEPIKSFPSLLTYYNKIDLSINVDLVERKNRLDFFSTSYFVWIQYPKEAVYQSRSTQKFEEYVRTKGVSLYEGPFSKENKFQNIANKSKRKNLSDILNKASGIKNTLLGAASLAASALVIAKKLEDLKKLKSITQLPEKPSVKFNKSLVTAKLRKSEQKPRKKKRLSGKKSKIPTEPNLPLSAGAEKLKAQAGNLTAQTKSQLQAAKDSASKITNKASELRKRASLSAEELVANATRTTTAI